MNVDWAIFIGPVDPWGEGGVVKSDDTYLPDTEKFDKIQELFAIVANNAANIRDVFHVL